MKLRGNRGYKGELGVDSREFLSKEYLGLKNHAQKCHMNKKTHMMGAILVSLMPRSSI